MRTLNYPTVLETVNGIELNHAHVYEGGTFVTNFKKDQREKYEEAIKKAGMEHRLIVCDNAYYGFNQYYDECHSLHMISGSFNLTEFWKIFRGIAV